MNSISPGFRPFRKLKTGLTPIASPPEVCTTIPFIETSGSEAAEASAALFNPRTTRYPLLRLSPGTLNTALRTLPRPPFSNAEGGMIYEEELTLLLSNSKSLFFLDFTRTGFNHSLPEPLYTVSHFRRYAEIVEGLILNFGRNVAGVAGLGNLKTSIAISMFSGLPFASLTWALKFVLSP